MAKDPVEGTEELEDSSTADEVEEGGEAPDERSLDQILDATVLPGTGMSTESMDWSDTLDGMESLLSENLDSKNHKQEANPTEGPGLSGGVKTQFTVPQLLTTEKKDVSNSKAHTHEEPATDGSGSRAPVTQTSKGQTGEYIP